MSVDLFVQTGSGGLFVISKLVRMGASATMEKPFLAGELFLEAEKLIITSKQ